MPISFGTPEVKANRRPFRYSSVCLSREPKPAEVGRLEELFNELLADYQQDPEAAKMMATDPLGPLPEGMKADELAAWTIVGNVLLNLDEMFMKR